MDEASDWLCIVWLLFLVWTDPYSESKHGEDWVQCKKCKYWAHLKCATSTSPIIQLFAILALFNCDMSFYSNDWRTRDLCI